MLWRLFRRPLLALPVAAGEGLAPLADSAATDAKLPRRAGPDSGVIRAGGAWGLDDCQREERREDADVGGGVAAMTSTERGDASVSASWCVESGGETSEDAACCERLDSSLAIAGGASGLGAEFVATTGGAC